MTLLTSTLLARDTTKETLATAAAQTDDLSFEIYNPGRKFSKINCLALVIGNHKLLNPITKIIQSDLEFSDQLAIDLKKNDTELKPDVLSKLFNQGTSLCLFIRERGASRADMVSLHVTLKDTASNQIFFEKNFTCHQKTIVKEAHAISDELMPILTGEKGPMLSTLAYCKQLSASHKVVCVADYACKYERTIVPFKTINVAPAWHPQEPWLLYSQFTRTKSLLKAYNFGTRTHNVICSFDGLNMQPTFSPDAVQTVLCLSKTGNSELYLYDQNVSKQKKQRIYKQLTHNKGNNSSPCLLPNGNIIFCSDYQTTIPQIYMMTANHKTVRRLTNGRGYCAAPAYCQRTNRIAYTRYVKRVFQIFMIDLDEQTPRERQLTFTQGDKVEPTWSECGRYVAFTYGTRDPKTGKLTNQIAVLNIMSGVIRVLTTSKEAKSFPCWTSRMLYQL